MRKPQNRKTLKLNTERVRVLSTLEVTDVAGGLFASRVQSNCNDPTCMPPLL